jgi:L-histidine Nalpha-methyltransferase
MLAVPNKATSLQILIERLAEARNNTDKLFECVRVDSLYERPIPERHRIAFYIGHLEAFDMNLFRSEVPALRPFAPEFDKLFAFGIDPVNGGLPTDRPEDWPRLSQIDSYKKEVRRLLDCAMQAGDFQRHDASAEHSCEALLNVATEHRLMHAETLTYMFHQLPFDRKRPQPQASPSEGSFRAEMLQISEGCATLGLERRNAQQFGWDNEFDAFVTEVPAFRIDKYMVTNGEFLDFLRSGGYENRQFWSEENWRWKQDMGSALFEVISLLPEYGVTRAEERILGRHAARMVSELPAPVIVAELGSGAGKKTRVILEALSRKQPISYYPIEISSAALAMCQRELSDIKSISIVGFEREYLDGLLEVAARREEDQNLMVLFLGSTIGNFDGTAGVKFLSRLREILREGDSLLLGTDLRKPIATLTAAYDDPLGVTAAFNRNLLVRINRELDADFDIEQFEHLAIFDDQNHNIEMHLRARMDQTVTIAKAGLSFRILRGETIWTETSHKYSQSELVEIVQRTGFRWQGQWIDDEWAFAENLWIAR